MIIRATTLKMVPLEMGVTRVPLRKLEHGPGHEAISVSNSWTYRNLTRLAIQEGGLRRPGRHGSFWIEDESLMGQRKKGESHQIR